MKNWIAQPGSESFFRKRGAHLREIARSRYPGSGTGQLQSLSQGGTLPAVLVGTSSSPRRSPSGSATGCSRCWTCGRETSFSTFSRAAPRWLALSGAGWKRDSASRRQPNGGDRRSRRARRRWPGAVSARSLEDAGRGGPRGSEARRGPLPCARDYPGSSVAWEGISDYVPTRMLVPAAGFR